MAEARVSQVVVEQAQASTTEARVSQVVVDAGLAPTIATRISQFVIEIVRGNGSGPTPQPSEFETRVVPVRWLRRGPIFSKENARVRWNLFQLDCQPGVGTSNAPGDDPVVFMRSSDDAGQTWSHIRQLSAGRQGQYSRQLQWWRCGVGRSRVFEVYGSDPVRVALVNAFAKVDPGTD